MLSLAALTVLIWVGESLFEYLYALRWRELAQNLQHELRMEAYATCSGWSWPGSSNGAPAA